MDIPYRTFATRSSRPNERFEQLSRGNVSGTTNGHSSRPPVSSSRKRVNVVTFRSTPSPVPTPDDVDKDVLPPLTKQPRCTTPVAVPPPAPLNIPTSVSTKHELRSGSENSLAATPLIAPKFRRKSSHRNGPTQVAPLKPSTANQRQKLPSSQPSKLPPPTTTNQKPEAADPYAWVEEEEPEPKPSEFAVREEDEVDDGVKPWFWPASREAAKQMTPSNTKATVKTDPRAINRIANDGGGAGGGDTKPRKIVVPRDQKSLYTVVEKVKDPSECQERGEVQHALDDMNYLIDGLSDTNSTNTRCLSVLTLANKCLTPATRDVIHAYGLLKQICANLHDAHTDYSLGLTAAGLFFVLSRDRDPDLLTSESLAVLLKLLHAPNTIMENASVDSATSTGSSKYTIGAASRQTRLNKEASQIRTRVQQLLEAVAAQQQKRSQKQQETPVKSPQPAAAAAGMAALFVRKNPGVASLFSGASGQKLLNARHLRMNRQLTARDLVLEAVLNLSTRKAAPWFKSGIRTGGGLDGVAEATIDAVDYLKDLCTADDPGKCRFLPTPATHNPTGLDDFSLDNLKRVGYYAKMLENMTYMNSDNQTHLVRYKERALIDRLVQCIHLCASRLPRHPPPSVAWVELLRKESEEKAAQVRSSGEDEREQQQPPTSSTEGEEFNKTSAASASPPTDEYQQDQQTLLTCLLSIFRLFVNVSHSEYASDRLGGCPGLLEATLDCLFHLPDRLPSSRRFDLLILILCLLANLCEHCPENRIRIVHLEVRSSESVAGVNHGAKLDNVGYEDDEGEGAADGSPRPSTTPTIPTVSALDEVVKLFLYREKKTLMHEFERDDEEGERSERKSEKAEEADSTTTTATSTLQRPKPPPSLLTDDGAMGETIEEAGLKWRLVGGNRHGGGNPLAGGSRSKSSKRSRLRAKRRRRRQALLSRGANKKTNFDKAASSDDEVEEDDDEDEEEEDDDELCSDEDESDGSDEEDEYDEDDELCGGADVEFVTETQEEQEKLKERMSSANQHMEDSVVAAYASLLLGCILQSSPRYAERIRARLPEPGKFRPLAIMLAKLLSFLSLARGVETAGSESILRIVRTLEAQDQPLSSTDSQASTSSNTLQPPTTRSALRARHV